MWNIFNEEETITMPMYYAQNQSNWTHKNLNMVMTRGKGICFT